MTRRTIFQSILAVFALCSCEQPVTEASASPEWREVEVVSLNRCESSWTDSPNHTVVKTAEGQTYKVGGLWGKAGDKLKLNASARYWVEWNK